MIRSDDAGRSAGFCFISTPHVRMNKNSPLNQCYICSIGADGVHSIDVEGWLQDQVVIGKLETISMLIGCLYRYQMVGGNPDDVRSVHFEVNTREISLE